MATIPPINYGALKVTIPANLPRNEKDLICMLLAGRLKNLWNGKLVCAQLAIDDLIKDLTGVSALGSLRKQLVKLKGSLNDFKSASGYDKILSGVNQALGQVSNVFSLGGLCPSPVTAPKIPDILGALNANLFGQANSILNALVKASNPKVCLGGGPKGFGVDWSKVTGDLKSLKNSIDQFKRDPAGLDRTMKAFESNIKSQRNRLNSELKRLEKNLSDPLGIGEKRNTVSAVQRAKSISDGYPVKDKNGITYKNATRSMIPGEVDSVLSRLEPNFSNPVKYVTKPVYDYCGNISGYERELVTGDAAYLGYDTVFDDFNTPTPTVNPTANAGDYDFFIVEEDNEILVYDTDGDIQSVLNLARGQHYRIGISITENSSLAIYNAEVADANAIWSNGITLTREPEFGKGFEIVAFDEACNSLAVEIDWAVSIENPTTPNSLYIITNTNKKVPINIDGPTFIPEEDKTYDISMLLKKSWLNIKHDLESTVDSNSSVQYETKATTRQYSMVTRIVKENGDVIEKTSTLKYGAGIKVFSDTETVEDGETVSGGKIITLTQDLGNSQYFVIKKFINDDSNFELNQLTFYLTNGLPTTPGDPQTHEQLAAISFENPLLALNDTKLPFKDYCDYKFSSGTTGKMNDTEENSVEKVVINNKTYVAFNLSANRYSSANSMEDNNFVYSSYIEINPSDPNRTYLDNDPIENLCQMYIKGQNGFLIDSVISYTGETTPANITLQVKSSPTGNYVDIDSDSIPTYDFQKNEFVAPFRPVNILGGLPPYTFKITPELPAGMIFDVDTGTIQGTPTDFVDRTQYKITFDSDDVLTYSVQFYITVATEETKLVTQAEINAILAAVISQVQTSASTTLASAISQYTGSSTTTVVGPSGPAVVPPELLDPNNEYFSTAPGYVWGIDSADPTSDPRWYFRSPVTSYITNTWQQINPEWIPAEKQWRWPSNTPGRPELAGTLATLYPDSIIAVARPGE